MSSAKNFTNWSEVLSRTYGFVRSRELEGTFPGSPAQGVWITTHLRVCKGWGCAPEAAWPYPGPTDDWPPSEPPGIDEIAKAKRFPAYQRVRDVDEALCALAFWSPFEVALPIVTDAWHNAPQGNVPDPTSANFDTSHAVCVTGYDKERRIFTFLNNWGSTWGDHGKGSFSFSYFTRHMLEAWVPILDVQAHPHFEQGGVVELQWSCMQSTGAGDVRIIEILDTTNDEMIAWSFMVEKQDYLDIEELFVRPTYRRRGYGRRLVDLICEEAKAAGRPLRAWLPRVDASQTVSEAASAVLRRLGLRANRSRRTWAAWVAM
jgi:GNAT superfamily N-acetyltransferase